MDEQKLIDNINKRKKLLTDIQFNTDIEIQNLTEEMQKDYQRVVCLENKAQKMKRKTLRAIRKEIEEQQKLLKQYEQIRYRSMVLKVMPKVPVIKNVIAAFIVGGIICSIGQIILNAFTIKGFTDVQAAAGTSGILVFLGALLTGLGIYDELGKFAGAGSIVPITGFANSITSPALEFKREGYIYGIGAKVFVIAGPVLLYGTLASIIVGLIFFITL
jgi:stage V sporulation protein AC